MRCGKCGRYIFQGSAYCAFCGRTLRVKKEKKGFWVRLFVVLGTALAVPLLGLGLATIALRSSSDSGTAETTLERSVKSVTIDSAPCGQNMGDVAEIIEAVKDRDVAGVVGIGARKGVLFLDQGTSVESYGKSMGLARVRIAAGIHRDETCWIPEKLLQ